MKNSIFLFSTIVFTSLLCLVTCTKEETVHKTTIQYVTVDVTATFETTGENFTYTYKSDYDGPIYPMEEVAADVGLGNINSHRNKWTDLNGDGWLDIILQVLSTEGTNATVFQSSGGTGSLPQFTDVTQASNIHQPTGTGSGRVISVLITGDIDNDGDLDLFSGAYCSIYTETDHGDRNEILLNDGSGNFTIVTNSGVGLNPETISGASFFDYNKDGNLDLFIGNWYRQYGASYIGFKNRLFEGIGDGTFNEVTSSVCPYETMTVHGYRNSSRPTYGITTLDYNNDGYQDVLISNYGRRWNSLYKNVGGNTFIDVGYETGIAGDDYYEDKYYTGMTWQDEDPFRTNGNTFDASCVDFDNDGDIDVFLGEIVHSDRGPTSDPGCLLVNLGEQEGYRFVRDTSRGIGRDHASVYWNQGDMISGWFDFDNDGLIDFVLASSDYPDEQKLRIYKQLPDHNFKNVTSSLGISWLNPTQISIGDFNRDGYQDIITGRSSKWLTGTHSLNVAIFKASDSYDNNWINIKLEGGGTGATNRSAIGARAYVTTGNTTQMRELHGSLGHFGHQDAMELHFGLGQADVIDELRIRWADNSMTEQIFTDVDVNQFIKITEGDNSVVKRF